MQAPMQPGTPVPPFSLVHVNAHVGHDAHIQELTMFNASPKHYACKHVLQRMQAQIAMRTAVGMSVGISVHFSCFLNF